MRVQYWEHGGQRSKLVGVSPEVWLSLEEPGRFGQAVTEEEILGEKRGRCVGGWLRGP